MDTDYLSVVKVFKAFCDENRIRVLEVLKNGEKCACTLLEELEISQPTLSHHMRILIDSGVVESRKDGRWTYYGLSVEGYKSAELMLHELLCRSDDYKCKCICD